MKSMSCKNIGKILDINTHRIFQNNLPPKRYYVILWHAQRIKRKNRVAIILGTYIVVILLKG